jgi:hypothetical protein
MQRAAEVVCMALLILGLLGTAVVAGDKVPMLLGFGYQHEGSEWQREGTEIEAGEMTRNVIYGMGAHPLAKGLWGYVQAGVSDLTLEVDGTSENFEGDFEPFVTVGLLSPLKSHMSIEIAPILQYTYYSDYTADDVWGFDKVKYKDFYEMYIGAEVYYPLGPGLLYAGPLVHWAKMKAEYTGGTLTSVPDENLEETKNLGGFVGYNYGFKNGIRLHLRGSYMSSFSFAVGISRFFTFKCPLS